MKTSLRLRLLRQGLATVLGLKPRGYFVPDRAAASTIAGRGGYPAIEAGLRAATDRFLDLLDLIDEFGPDLAPLTNGPGEGAAPPAPRFAQGWFPRLDAAAAYTLVRWRRPRRIVEIGSGHSTRFLARAVADGRLETGIVAIDPAPRASLDGLAVQVVRRRVQEVPGDAFADLAPGDMLFVDSSHLALPGSDVDHVVGRILPLLPAGVLVHFHDIFLPDDYPEAWHWRGYNEQQVVAALLTGGFEPVFASHYVATRLARRLSEGVLGRVPIVAGAPEGSLWLRKTSSPLSATRG